MIASKFLTVRRRVAGFCWTLLALTILAAPGLSWAACNTQLTLGKDPDKNGTGGYTLGETLTVKALVGGSTVASDEAVTVSEFRFALDCISADPSPLIDCLGYGVDPVNDAIAQDDGDAIEYAGGDISTGNLTVTGGACSGSTFTVNSTGTEGSPAADPNIVVITANPAVVFSPGVIIQGPNGPELNPNNTCDISFKAHLNSYGKTFETSTTQNVRNGAGFKGNCPNQQSSTPNASDNFLFEVVPSITIKKYVNLDGKGYVDAQDEETWPAGLVPTSTALYRLVVTNNGTEPLKNVLISDSQLLLDKVALPDRCYVNGVFPPLADAPANECIIEATDSPAFDNLGNPPVKVCETSGRKRNEATVNGDGAFSTQPAGPSSDEANVECFKPEIKIIKFVNVDNSGWVDANNAPFPVGIVPNSTALYRLVVTNIGTEPLVNVVLSDLKLGLDKVALPDRCYVNGVFPPLADAPANECIIEATDSPAFDNLGKPPVKVCETAVRYTNIACTNGDGAFTKVAAPEACDPANVDCIDPAIEVTKTGPNDGKVGDQITYTICAENKGEVDLTQCVLEDKLLFPTTTPAFAALLTKASVTPTNKVCNDYPYTIAAGDITAGTPDQVKNTAKVTCNVAGTNPVQTVNDVANWDVDVFKVSGVLTKDCQPETAITVPGKIDWDICIENTGDKDMTCDVTDTKAFTGTKQLGPIAPGAANKLCLPDDLSRATTSADVGTVSNTANATCTVARVGQVDNKFDLPPATDTCEVEQDVLALCRTPGFWGTHGGEEKEGRSANLVQEVITYNGGDLGEICGLTIDTTALKDDGSALEAICVHPKTKIVRQLMRQMTAAALNCVMSGTSPNCAALSIGKEWAGADAACKAGDDQALISSYIEKFDDFNNGVYPGSVCKDTIKDSDVFKNATYKVPGPAGSSWACNDAIQNGYFLVPELTPTP